MSLSLGSIYLWAARNQLDADAESFLTRAAITDATQRAAINALVLGLKANSLWTLLSAFYPFVGGSASAHSHNLKSSSYQISWAGTVTHDSNGITGDGTTGWGDSGWDSATSAAQNSLHAYCYCRTAAPTAGGRFFGAANNAGTSRVGLVRNGASLAIDGIHNFVANFVQVGASTDFRGSMCQSRTASTTHRTYLRAIAPVSETTASALACVESVGILARNFEGFGPDSFSNANLSAVSLGAGLSDAQYTALASVVDAFQTALGRNV